jgi:ribonuclease BN (tRNA processing enzyme)
LISGEHDAVMIDADLAATDCWAVVTWVLATGWNLPTIYITPRHGDHFFGLNTILGTFPAATAATAAAIAAETPEQISSGQRQLRAAMFPGQMPGHPPVPAVQSTGTDQHGQRAENHRRRGVEHRSPDDRPHLQPDSDSRSACKLADAMMAVPGEPVNAADSRKGVFKQAQTSIVIGTLTSRQAASATATRVEAGR